MVCLGPFDTERDIPDLSSKVILVTGGNSGVGKESIKQLSKHHPAKLYMTARSKAKYDAAVAEIIKVVPDANITFLEMDLASFASIKTAASAVLAENNRLDILINNAGVMALPPGKTVDGYEIQFGTNHMGHALLTKLLMPLLLKTAEEPNSDVRIVNLSSAAHMMGPKLGFVPEEVTTTMASSHTYSRYGQSKLANVLFTKELARRYPGVKSVAIHPGRVRTPLLDEYMKGGLSFMGLFQKSYDYFAMMDVEKGALNQLWAAVGPKEKVTSGCYYAPVAKEGGNAASKNLESAKKLWDWQEGEFARLGY